MKGVRFSSAGRGNCKCTQCSCPVLLLLRLYRSGTASARYQPPKTAHARLPAPARALTSAPSPSRLAPRGAAAVVYWPVRAFADGRTLAGSKLDGSKRTLNCLALGHPPTGM
jgi:hypothetical protein